MSTRSPTQGGTDESVVTQTTEEVATESETPVSNAQIMTQMSGASGDDGVCDPYGESTLDMFGEEGEFFFWDADLMMSGMSSDGETSPDWSLPAVSEESSLQLASGNDVAVQEETPAPEEAPAEEQIDMARIQERSHQLFTAMDGWGTNEDNVLGALRGLSAAEISALESEFQAHYGHDLRTMIESEMGGEDLTEAEALMTADPVDSAIAALNNSTGFWNDDEGKIEETLRGLSDADRQLLLERMPEDQLAGVREALVDWVPGGGDGADAEVFDALVSGDTADAAAIRLDEAMGSSGSWYNPGTWGTDEEGVYGALESMPSEERGAIVDAFNQRMADQGIETDLDAQLDAEFSGAAQDVASHLAAGEDVAAQAARIMDAGEGMGTNEQAIFDALNDPRMQSSDPAVRDAALAEREELLGQFESMYGQSMDEMLSSELGELDTERAEQLREGGELDPAFAIYYASEAGWGGTDEEMITGALSGRSTEEIAQIQADYDAEYASRYGASFDATLEAELSGRDSFDVGLLRTYGNTNDPELLVQRMEEQYQFERGTGSNGFSRTMMDFAGVVGYSSSAEVLDNNYERLQGCLDEEGNITNTDGLSDILRWNDDDVADYVAAKESVTEGLATGAEIVAAAVATVLTEGAASPWLVAALGALAGGTAGIAVRAGMGGDAYGSQEFGADAVNVLVQTLAAGLAKGVVDPRLEELLEGQPELLAAIARGAGNSAASGLMTGAVDEEAWRNGPGDVLLAMGQSAGTGLVTGGVSAGVENVVGGHMDDLVDTNTYSGAGMKGAATGFSSGVATTAIDPATYDGRIEDVLGTLAVGGGKNAVQGGLSEMGSLHNRARSGAFNDQAAGRERSAEQLEAEGWTPAQIEEYQSRMRTDVPPVVAESPESAPAVLPAADEEVAPTSTSTTDVDGDDSEAYQQWLMEQELLGRIDAGGQEAVLDRVLQSDDPAEQQRVMELMQDYESIMRKDPQQMTSEERDVVISAQAELARGFESADTMRKVIPEEDMLKYFSGEFGPSVGGSVGDARNTDGLSPSEMIARLGLDYTDRDGNQPYLQSDASSPTGQSALDEVFFMDMPMTDELRQRSQIPLDSELAEHAQTSGSADAEYLRDSDQVMSGDWQNVRYEMDADGDYEMDADGNRIKEDGQPYTGTGGTAAHESNLSDAPVVNQERQIATDRAAGDYGAAMPEGTQIKVRGPDGEDIVIATYRGTYEHQPSWVMNQNVPPELRERFEGRIRQDTTTPF